MVRFTRLLATRLRRSANHPARALGASRFGRGVGASRVRLHGAVASGGRHAPARADAGERAGVDHAHRPTGTGGSGPHPGGLQWRGFGRQRGRTRRVGSGRSTRPHRVGDRRRRGMRPSAGLVRPAVQERGGAGSAGDIWRGEETFHPPHRIQPRGVIGTAFDSCRPPIASSRATWTPRPRPFPWTAPSARRRHLRRRTRSCASRPEWSRLPPAILEPPLHRSGPSWPGRGRFSESCTAASGRRLPATPRRPLAGRSRLRWAWRGRGPCLRPSSFA